MNPQLAAYPLLAALRDRRSRRFGLGMKMPAGPLAYTSRHQPAALTEEEEATLAWAACGISGPALGDLCYAPQHGGNIMAGMVGRTIASGDCLQTVALVVINDSGTWFVKRPQDFSPEQVSGLVELSRCREFTEIYRRTRVQLFKMRVFPPVEPIFNINANRWSAQANGSSYFLPIGDLTPMYLNGLLEILNEDTGCYILDERAGFRPAGLAKFAKSRGGHLDDDPAHGKVIAIKLVEQLVTDFVNHEMGMVLQNLGLMTQALGLGGFPHFANHDFAWFQALGFTLREMPASQFLGARGVVALGMKLLGKDLPVPYPLGLERDGQSLMIAFTPPYHASMTEAVRAIADRKFGPLGVFRNPHGTSSWHDHRGVTAQVGGVSERAIAAATAYAEYVWQRYGRFPAHVPPFRCGLAHQVVHVDAEFYDRFYRAEALSETQRADWERTVG